MAAIGMTLRSKMLLSFLAVSVIPIAVIALYLFENVTKDLAQNAETELQAVLDSRILEIEAYVAEKKLLATHLARLNDCLLYTSPSPRDQRGSRMPSSA